MIHDCVVIQPVADIFDSDDGESVDSSNVASNDDHDDDDDNE